MEVSDGGAHPLVVGGSLTLTCNVTIIQEGVREGMEVSIQWLKGDEREEIGSVPTIELRDENIGSYMLEHSFEALSTTDSDTYKCEASLWFHNVGIIATASHSMDISVQGIYVHSLQFRQFDCILYMYLQNQ